MSKDCLNDIITIKETDKALVDTSPLSNQADSSDLIQKNAENNQSSKGSDIELNSEPSGCDDLESNLISGDLKNVNTPGDSGSINENSTSEIKKSDGINNGENKTTSQSTLQNEFSEPDFGQNETTTTKETLDLNVSKGEYKNSSNNIQKATEEVNKDQLEAKDSDKEISDTLEGEEINNDKGTVIKDRDVSEICSAGGPYFSRPSESDGTGDKYSDPKTEANGVDSGANGTVELQFGIKAKEESQNPTLASQETNLETEDQEKDTSVPQKSDQEEKVESEAYEDDFEDHTEDDQNNGCEQGNNVTDDNKSEKAIDSQENKEEQAVVSESASSDIGLSEKSEEKPTPTANTESETLSSEVDKSVICEESKEKPPLSEDTECNNKEISNVNENVDIDVSTSEKHKHEESGNKTEINGITVNELNENSDDAELTQIVINEEGIPKVAITTVPDRPPSSQASDGGRGDEDFPEETGDSITKEGEATADQAQLTGKEHDEKNSDPFEDFPIDDDNKSASITNKNTPSDTQRKDEQEISGDKMDGSDVDKTNNDGKEISTEVDVTGDHLKNDESETQAQNSNIKETDNGSVNADLDKNGKDEQSDSNECNDEGLKERKSTREEQSFDKPTRDGNDDAPKAHKNNPVTGKSEKSIQQQERSKSPEPAPVPQQDSPLEQMLKRNVKIDGTVDSVTELETNVVTLLTSMKEVMSYYSDLLKLQAMKDFTSDLGKFKGDFTSINEAFKRCNKMSLNINQHLKELRHNTEDVRQQIHRKFQQEDLSTWIDASPGKEKEKERMQEEAVAAEKAAMAKAAEARHAVSTAVSGVAEAQQLISEMETQAADAEAISQKASAQARAALIAAEEARVAAEERKRVEEASKKRTEERARIKAAEEEKKRALEEMKIHQEAAAKGTSVEDERRSFMEEKKRKELERKNPKNWPRYSYKTDGVDFNPAIGCIIRAIDGSMSKTDVTCSFVDQSQGPLKLANTEELVSNIINVKQVEADRTFSFEEPLSLALPVSIGRVPTGKETVVKQLMPNGVWKELPSADVQFEDYRELKFVEGRCSKFGTFAVVLRPKKDTLQFLKKGSKLLCSSDSRISFTNKPGSFKQNINAVLEVQTLETNTISDLKMRSPKECEDIVSASPFIKFSLPHKNLDKPLTVSLPLPQVQTRQKRPATGITRETKSQDLRPQTARPSTTSEAVDDSSEEIFFLYRDDKSTWTVNPKMHLVQPPSKDTVTFDIAHPYQRMVLIRCKAGKSATAVEKMATLLENITTQRNVKVIARQRNDDVAEVIVACTSASRTERTLKYMEERSFTEGPNPSPNIVLQEGQELYMKFRGNMECVSQNPSLSFIFNTNIRASREFRINEKEEFAQKSLPCFRGFIQIFTKALVPRPAAEGAPKNTTPEMVEAEILLTELLVELPKPEAEPPKPLATAPLFLKEGPLTNGVLRYIAGMLGKEWKDVAAQLNLKPMRIQAILRNHMNKDTAETRFEMLVSWAKRVPKSVDKVQILYNALVACNRPDIAEEVRHRGQQYKQQRFMSARVSHLRQAFVKVAKTTAVFNHWKTFAKNLGVPDDKIKSIDESGGSGQEKCYTSLETWKDAAGEDATVTSLSSYLKTAKQDRLSRDVESLVAS